MKRRDVLKWPAWAIAAGAWPWQAGASAAADLRRERLPWRHDGETLHLAVVRRPGPGDAVLYVHGATFPAALSVGWRMQGVSWLDRLQAAGFDAWAFDFAGYGGSDRPRAFAGDAFAHPPFGRCEAAAAQIATVLRHIRQARPGVPIHLVAHSWGTLPAQRAAIALPEWVDRLVLFGPPVVREGERDPQRQPAWRLVSAAQQRPRQRIGLPPEAPTPVDDAELERWCSAYLATDPESASRAPHAVKIPNGPAADLAELWAGQPLVDPARIRQPTLIVRGEWDHVTRDEDARRLFDRLSGVRDKRDVKISGGNHWLHLQPRRTALWAQTLSFLREDAVR